MFRKWINWSGWVRGWIGIWKFFRGGGYANLCMHETLALLANAKLSIDLDQFFCQQLDNSPLCLSEGLQLLSELPQHVTGMLQLLLSWRVPICSTSEVLFSYVFRIVFIVRNINEGSFPFFLSRCLLCRPSRNSLRLHFSSFNNGCHFDSFFTFEFHTKVLEDASEKHGIRKTCTSGWGSTISHVFYHKIRKWERGHLNQAV